MEKIKVKNHTYPDDFLLGDIGCLRGTVCHRKWRHHQRSFIQIQL